MSCVCGKGETTEACCLPIIKGEREAQTAEELMRSRYAAYVLGEIDYVVASHDPGSRDDIDREGATQWSQGATWLGLDIVKTVAGGASDDQGEVEFIAKYAVKGHELTHHEHSTFGRIDGKWHYVDGEMIKQKPKTRETPKVGRNEPCPCGSGKKYKKCHGQAA